MKRVVEIVSEALDLSDMESNTIRKKGCRISLKNAPKTRLIVDFDKSGSPLAQDQSRCDYLFVADGRKGQEDWIVPIELKRGSIEADTVLRQLSAGAAVAEQIVPRSVRVKFRPTAAFNGIHKGQIDKLKTARYRISFHGKSEPIRLIKCGGVLQEALRS